jgi:hypothetical protein
MRVKNLTKTQTVILSDIYNVSRNYSFAYRHGRFIDAALQLKELYPDMFTVDQEGISSVTITMIDGQLKNLFELLKHNEEKLA